MEEVIKSISSHLEFLGYEVIELSDEPRALVARGGSKPENIMIQYKSTTILFRSSYPNDDGFSEKDANELNREFIVSRCVFVDNNTISIECSIPAFYDKKSFGAYIEEYKGEIREFLEYEILRAEKIEESESLIDKDEG